MKDFSIHVIHSTDYMHHHDFPNCGYKDAGNERCLRANTDTPSICNLGVLNEPAMMYLLFTPRQLFCLFYLLTLLSSCVLGGECTSNSLMYLKKRKNKKIDNQSEC